MPPVKQEISSYQIYQNRHALAAKSADHPISPSSRTTDASRLPNNCGTLTVCDSNPVAYSSAAPYSAFSSSQQHPKRPFRIHQKPARDQVVLGLLIRLNADALLAEHIEERVGIGRDDRGMLRDHELRSVSGPFSV
jgi:hypothetical protein